MKLIRSRKEISKDQIKTGHVLEIEYDGDIDLILVVDPKAEAITNMQQGRVGKLHAIKLQSLVDTDLAKLIAMVRGVKNKDGRTIYETFKTSLYADGKRNYRTYTPDKIGKVVRVSVGQTTKGTNKMQIGDSILYGVEHGSHVQLATDDYDTFAHELNTLQNTFYEGPEGHEVVTQQLMRLTIQRVLGGQSWEPSDAEFDAIAYGSEVNDTDGLGRIGGNLAGWWNQWIDGDTDGGKTATNNIKNAWQKVDPNFKSTIGEVFAKSVGDISTIAAKWKTYTYNGRTYDWPTVSRLLNKKGWTSDGLPTKPLRLFNEAGHFQVFPEDNDWNKQTKQFEGNVPEQGELFAAQSTFNNIRDIHLINKMKSMRGVYFAGFGHLDNLRRMGYGT